MSNEDSYSIPLGEFDDEDEEDDWDDDLDEEEIPN